MLMFTLNISCLIMSKFTLIHGPNIPSSYVVLFIAPDVTFTTRCIHNLGSFPLCPSLFILSGAIFHSSTVAYWTCSNLEGSSSGVISYWLFILFMGFSRQEYRSSLPFPPPVDRAVSELSTMTHPSWTALHNMAHSFFELHKPLHHKTVIHGGAIYSDLEPIFFHIE